MENPSPRRVSLRHVDELGQAHDVVGELVLADDARIVLLPHGRGPVEVPRGQVRAMKWAPPRMVRPTSRVADVERMLARTWPGTAQVRLGGWVLRTGRGATRRANSVLPDGTPERPLDEALAAVDGFYRERGLRPTVQVAARRPGSDEQGSELDASLEERGWTAHGRSLAMVLPLSDVGGAEVAVAATTAPDEVWQSIAALGEDRLAEALAAPARYATVALDDRAAACARLAPCDDWVVLSELRTDPACRRRGLARALVTTILAQAREEGFGFAAVQVQRDHTAAVRLYEQLGFTVHHASHYRSPAEG